MLLLLSGVCWPRDSEDIVRAPVPRYCRENRLKRAVLLRGERFSHLRRRSPNLGRETFATIGTGQFIVH